LGSKFILATGNKITDKISIGTNWGITWTGNNQNPISFYIINFSYNMNDNIGIFAEIYGNLNDFSANYDTGLSFLINRDFQLDIERA